MEIYLTLLNNIIKNLEDGHNDELNMMYKFIIDLTNHDFNEYDKKYIKSIIDANKVEQFLILFFTLNDYYDQNITVNLLNILNTLADYNFTNYENINLQIYCLNRTNYNLSLRTLIKKRYLVPLNIFLLILTNTNKIRDYTSDDVCEYIINITKQKNNSETIIKLLTYINDKIEEGLYFLFICKRFIKTLFEKIGYNINFLEWLSTYNGELQYINFSINNSYPILKYLNMYKIIPNEKCFENLVKCHSEKIINTYSQYILRVIPYDIMRSKLENIIIVFNDILNIFVQHGFKINNKHVDFIYNNMLCINEPIKYTNMITNKMKSVHTILLVFSENIDFTPNQKLYFLLSKPNNLDIIIKHMKKYKLELNELHKKLITMSNIKQYKKYFT